MTNQMTKVESIHHLLSILHEDESSAAEFFIQIGAFRSWKTISLGKNCTLWVLNQIDESEEKPLISELEKDTNDIGKAIRDARFYYAWR